LKQDFLSFFFSNCYNSDLLLLVGLKKMAQNTRNVTVVGRIELSSGDLYSEKQNSASEALVRFKAVYLADPTINAATYFPDSNHLHFKRFNETNVQLHKSSISFVGGQDKI
jgi:hypothetical protein